jgi:hypothetical protein
VFLQFFFAGPTFLFSFGLAYLLLLFFHPPSSPSIFQMKAARMLGHGDDDFSATYEASAPKKPRPSP